MQQAADYITEEKKKSLLKELAELKGPKRKEILIWFRHQKNYQKALIKWP